MARAGEGGGIVRPHAAGGAVALRPMRREDLRAVVEIERLVFSSPWTRSLFERELRDPRARLVVAVAARAEGEPLVIGYSSSCLVADEAQLLNLAVHPRHQGMGLGRRLLEDVIADSRCRGARALFLEVRVSNVVARRLYRRAGFRDVGVRRGYYGPGQDAIVMALRFDRS